MCIVQADSGFVNGIRGGAGRGVLRRDVNLAGLDEQLRGGFTQLRGNAILAHSILLVVSAGEEHERTRHHQRQT